MRRGGLRIAFLARTMITPDGVIYREDAPGVAMLDPDRIVEEVRAARRQAHLVIVSLHWGIEYARYPQEEQRRLAHRLIDAGACLVLGHHPHTPQPLERYHRGVIAYSLGNFVFDATRPRARTGALLRCTLTVAGVRAAQLIPVVIHRGQPRPSSRARINLTASETMLPRCYLTAPQRASRSSADRGGGSCTSIRR